MDRTKLPPLRDFAADSQDGWTGNSAVGEKKVATTAREILFLLSCFKNTIT
jgi:hypothetical protein